MYHKDMATELITTRALTNLERIKTRLGIDSAGFDTLIERMIMGITDEIESRCNRKFATATYTHLVCNSFTLCISSLCSLLSLSAPYIIIFHPSFALPFFLSHQANCHNNLFPLHLIYFFLLAFVPDWLS